jgi:flagellar assembly protein FliH
LSNSKVISNTDAAAAGANTWLAPEVEDSAADALKGAAESRAHQLTTRQVDQLTDQAHQEAHRSGYQEGLAAGQAELMARCERLDALMRALARPLDDVDEQVEQELVNLASVLARHILRRELRQDPSQVLGSVRDCLEILPSAARDVTLRLNPQDAQLVREYFSQDDIERSWRIEEDPTLEQGSLRVSSDSSSIDGRLETRLGEILGRALGTGRAADQD